MRTSTKVRPKTRRPADRGSARRRLTAAERREKFLDVAAELIAESGIEAVTMERVAERSAVSKALGYGYFENSDKLLAAVFKREVARLDERVLASIAGVNDARERMVRMMEAVFEVVSNRGAVLGRLFQSRRSGGALEEARRERQQFVERYFSQMMEQDAGVPAKSAAIAAKLWVSAVNGALDLWAARRVPVREVVDVFSRMVAGSIQALRSGQP